MTYGNDTPSYRKCSGDVEIKIQPKNNNTSSYRKFSDDVKIQSNHWIIFNLKLTIS